jgi:hypothetical protein
MMIEESSWIDVNIEVLDAEEYFRCVQLSLLIVEVFEA